ncbi:MAG: hypothetical protein M1838_000072 [Thelocarpon superellum]|nr:MAG: hypothetical protein M1838_000072 [Thelocarpon superellum]
MSSTTPNSAPLSIAQLTQVLSDSAAYPSSELVDTLADYEAQACLFFTDKIIKGDEELLLAYYSSYAVALLLNDELPEARYLACYRFPPSLTDKSHVLTNKDYRLSETKHLLSAVKDLLRAVWSRDYPLVYHVLQHAKWLDIQRTLIERYLVHFRKSHFQLLSRAYRSIPPTLAAKYIGLEIDANAVDEAPSTQLEQLTTRGWKWHAPNGLLLPTPVAALEKPRGDTAGPGGGDPMARLVGLVGFLGE